VYFIAKPLTLAVPWDAAVVEMTVGVPPERLIGTTLLDELTLTDMLTGPTTGPVTAVAAICVRFPALSYV
jgi:hypothetical protein